jgi:hypothetical protein
MNMKLAIGALVAMLSGCAAAGGGTAPPSADATGTWVGTWSLHNPTVRYPEIASGSIYIVLKQVGVAVTDDLTMTGSTTTAPRSVEGAVSGSSIILKSPYLSGFLDVRSDEMTGVIGENGQPANVWLRRQRERRQH